MFRTYQYTLLGLFIFAIHFTMPTPGGSGLYMPFNVMTWVFISVIIFLGLWQITSTKQIKLHNLHIFMIIGFVLMCLPMFYGGEYTDYAIPKLLALLTALVFLFASNQFTLSKQQNHQLLYLILLGTAISSLFSLGQFYLITEGSWGGYTAGESRPIGLFLQPNVTASLLSTGLIIAIYLTLDKKIEKSLLQKRLLKYILFVSPLLLVLLQSRTGFLGALVGMSLLIPHALKQQNLNILKPLALILAGILTAIISMQFIKHVDRGLDVYQEVGARSDMYKVSAHMIYTKPLTGFGYGEFEKQYREFHLAIMPGNPNLSAPLDNLDHPHNEILYWGVEGGIAPILGLVIFSCGFLFLFAHTKWRKSLALIALIMPILLHSLTEYPFYHSTPHLVVFLLLISFIQNSLTSFKTINCQPTLLIKTLAVGQALIIIPFMVTTLHTSYLVKEYIVSSSEDSKTEYLREIINPIAWKSQIERLAYTHKLEVGFVNQDPEALKGLYQIGE